MAEEKTPSLPQLNENEITWVLQDLEHYKKAVEMQCSVLDTLRCELERVQDVLKKTPKENTSQFTALMRTLQHGQTDRLLGSMESRTWAREVLNMLALFKS